ncbi:hypothetical protein CDAR_58971 [Caerostris darwini]|uniref:Secreted protein n=1 Tax=Caerostris darwini TaxID=1538125 RepID=A0AAV4X5E1_9ARAC|nr:hypothetical protein CDAR_58971 [Caerostris darwini]
MLAGWLLHLAIFECLVNLYLPLLGCREGCITSPLYRPIISRLQAPCTSCYVCVYANQKRQRTSITSVRRFLWRVVEKGGSAARTKGRRHSTPCLLIKECIYLLGVWVSL